MNYDYIGSRVEKRSYPAININSITSYDNLGRVTNISAGTLIDFDYTYVGYGNNDYDDNENNIDTITFGHRTSDPYNDYDYDGLDRLTDVVYHNTDEDTYVMDDLGNRSGTNTLRDANVSYTADNETNEYTNIGGVTSMTYDNAGSLTERPTTNRRPKRPFYSIQNTFFCNFIIR